MNKKLGPSELILETYSQHPRTALLMSDDGIKAESILNDEEVRDLFDINTIISDKEDSRAIELGERFGLDTLIMPVHKFSSPERPQDFRNIASELGKRGVDAAIYAGFLKIATKDFCEEFPSVSCHPADLSITDQEGTRLYTGWRGMSEMRRDTGSVRSTIHAVTEKLDDGQAFGFSEYVYPESNQDDDELLSMLHEKESIVYPRILKLLAKGAINTNDAPLASEDIYNFYPL